MLGAATNAVFVWGRFFTQALLYAGSGFARKALARLVIRNVGMAAALAGAKYPGFRSRIPSRNCGHDDPIRITPSTLSSLSAPQLPRQDARRQS